MDQRFDCPHCNASFTREDNLKRHTNKSHTPGPEVTVQQRHQCPDCPKQFTRAHDLSRHRKKHHAPIQVENLPVTFKCSSCDKEFGLKQNLKRHEAIHARKRALPGNPPQSPQPLPSLPSNPPQRDDPTVSAASTSQRQPGTSRQTPAPAEPQSKAPLLSRLIPKQALRGALVSYTSLGSEDDRDPMVFLADRIDPIAEKVREAVGKRKGIKLSMSLKIKFFKPTGPETTTESHFWSKQEVVVPGSDVEEKVFDCFPKIFQSIDEFTSKGSGWVIEQVLGLEVHIAKYRALRGSTFTPVPPKLQAKKAILNIINNDDKCFLWSVLAALHPVGRHEHANRVSNYQQYENELNLEGIEFPMKVTQIPKFEEQNNLCINVYGFEDDELYPIRLSERTDGQHIGLLLYNGHYSLVRNLNRLLSDQRRMHGNKWFCHRCLFPFYERGRLDEHMQYCMATTRQTMSDKPCIKFENYQRMQKQPVVVYADFECLLEPLQSCAPDPSKSSTDPYQRHTPCGFGLVESRSCCDAAQFQEPVVYRGADCVDKFLDNLQSIAVDYHERLDNAPGLNMTPADECAHQSDTCHICQKQIEDPKDKVRDHCHICGRYRGPAHNFCNQQYRLNRDIVVVFHNLRRYDGHIVMQKITEGCAKYGWEPSCIAKAMEDYLGFRLHTPRENGSPRWSIKFVDSAQFLSSSLDKLVRALPREDFKALSDSFKDPTHVDLLVRKGVYPYEYMNSPERFEETQLPPKEAFYSKLSKSGISDEDYAHAQKVWDTFPEIHNMGDFHDHYLLSDTLQLADVVEKFRGVCMENYGLDPMHFITLPSFAWDACLKATGIELETIQDPDIYTFIESGIRGGMSVIVHRACIANNPMCPGFDPNKPVVWILYLDANNLYGWAMVQLLPTHGFRWFYADDLLTAVDWRNTTDGYFVEVDLDYPAGLHDLHNDYPLAAEKMVPPEVSPYCQRLQEEIDVGPTTEKLIPNLQNKRRYVMHIKNLQQCMREGMELKKVHRALRFEQSAWMAPYIQLNTQLRAAATNDFEKDLFKLMNNAVFGKTMENTRGYKDVRLVTRESQFIKLAKNPRYSRSVIFNENFVGVLMDHKTVCLDKPIYVGFSVLELSKTLMYDFHYDHMVKRYKEPGQLKLLFSDTDSLMYAVQTPDVYADMLADQHLYDTSAYPRYHPLFSLTNKKVLGKMKDEMNGLAIWKFIGLRSKMYSFVDAEGTEKKRAKGIKKATVKNEIAFADYQESLEAHTVFHHQMNLIRSDRHQLNTVAITKKSLSPYDDKRYLCDDGIATLAYGHEDIALLNIPLMDTDEPMADLMEIDA